MKKQKIGIIDHNEIFAKRLAGFLNKDEGLPFVAVVFTRADALKRYLTEKSLAFLISGMEEIIEAEDIPVIRLVEKKTTDYGMLYRYQKASLIKTDILERYEYLLPEKLTGESLIYGIYSPIGRCGKTTFALELLRQLRGSMYIGMETFNSINMDCGSIEPLLYGIMQKDETVFSELMELSGDWDGRRLLRSPDCYADLKYIDIDHLSWFLRGLSERTGITSVVMDIGPGVFEGPEMLKVCDRIIVPYDTDNDIRINSMESGFKKIGLTEITDRMEYVRMPVGADGLRELAKTLIE